MTAIAALAVFTAYAQNSITGTVKSESEDEILVGANVVLLPISKGSTTDKDGEI